MRPALSEKTGIDLDAGDIGRAPREQRGEVAATRADLEHRFVRFELQLLQDPSFHLGRPHAFAVAQRYFEIGERQGPIRGRDEVFAPDLKQQVEHFLIQHRPGADLLLDHVEACLLEIHAFPFVQQD